MTRAVVSAAIALLVAAGPPAVLAQDSAAQTPVLGPAYPISEQQVTEASAQVDAARVEASSAVREHSSILSDAFMQGLSNTDQPAARHRIAVAATSNGASRWTNSIRSRSRLPPPPALRRVRSLLSRSKSLRAWDWASADLFGRAFKRMRERIRATFRELLARSSRYSMPFQTSRSPASRLSGIV